MREIWDTSLCVLDKDSQLQIQRRHVVSEAQLAKCVEDLESEKK